MERWKLCLALLVPGAFACDGTESEPWPVVPFPPADRALDERIPDRGYDVLRYDLSFRLPHDRNELIGDATIVLTTSAAIDRIELDFAGFRVEGVELDGSALDASRWRRGADDPSLPPDSFVIDSGPLSSGSHTVRIRYSGKPVLRQHSLGEIYVMGFQGFEDSARLETLRYTQNQPEGARLWFPCFDHPSDKATLRLSFAVPPGLSVVSNGELQQGSPVDVEIDGQPYDLFTWIEPSAIATYLIAVTVGPLELREPYEIDGVRIQDYTPTTLDAAAVHAQIEPVMRNAIPMFQELLGPYPFEKYGHVLITEGRPIPGMEHQTISLIDARYLLQGRPEYRENVLVHELIHSWLGNYVTPRSHRHYWFSEGLATYLSLVYVEKTGEYPLQRFGTLAILTGDWVRAWYDWWARYQGDLVLVDLPEREALRDPPYYKGAAVFAMLRLEIGDDAFFLGLRNLLMDHGFGSAGAIEIEEAMEQAYGADLSWFFDQWVYTKGFPLLNYECAARTLPIYSKVQLDCTFEQAQTDVRRLAAFWRETAGNFPAEPFPLYRVSLPVYVEGKGAPNTADEYIEWRVHLEARQKQTRTLCLDFVPKSVTVDTLHLMYGGRRRGTELEEVPFTCVD